MNTTHRLAACALIVCSPWLARASAPDPPSGPSPANGAIDITAGASLCVDVTDPDGDALQVAFHARKLSDPAGSDFEVIVLPDSQYYAQSYPSIFRSQTEWIVAHRKARNIVFVSHVGDIVHIGNVPTEWANVDAAMSLLEDPATTELPEGIPYAFSVGNHDQSPNDNPGSLADPGATTPLFNGLFGLPRYETRNWYGGHWGDNNDNSYQLFEAGGMKFVVLHLEYDNHLRAPDLLDEVLDWADQILETYSDRRAILTSHSILCNLGDGTGCPATLWSDFSVQGQIIYDRLKHHRNLFLALCGHAASTYQQPRRTDTFGENTLHTTLQNYQRSEDCPYWCGNGWLRIYRFRPSADVIEVKTYSPWLDQYKTDLCSDGSSCHDFDLAYDMEGGVQFEQVGTVGGVQSGMTPCVSWTGRAAGETYEWYVSVSDGTDSVTGDRWTFTSDGSCVLPADCDDGDACTVDACGVGGTCEHLPVADCCEADSDCDDGNYCTDDSCIGGFCSQADNSNACSDGDACTVSDVCQAGGCAGTAIVCDDGNGCTTDGCSDGACVASYTPVPACCASSADCDDSNRCTVDTCEPGGDCLNTPVSGCCSTVADCPDDADACTVETCTPWNEAALRFDGIDDHVTMHQAPGLGLAEFTVECWFKWDGGGSPVSTSGWFAAQAIDTGGVVARPLVTKGLADQEFGYDNPAVQNLKSVNYFLGISEPDLVHPQPVIVGDFEEHPSGSAIYGGQHYALNHAVYGATPISIDEWHHAAMTYDGSCWQLYLDGQPETDGTNCPAEPPAYESQCHLAIGSAQDRTGSVVARTIWGLMEGRFSGLIDEVRIWDHARSAGEVAADMGRAIEAAPGLAGRWGLDRRRTGSDFLTADSTGHYDGVVVDGTFEASDLVDLGGGVCEAPLLLPTEVAGLAVAGPTLSWQGQGAGTTYDVASGLLSELRADGGVDRAQCLVDEQEPTALDDTRPDPPPTDGYYYLVRSSTSCGAGSYGFATGGLERLPPGACP